jgi:hypothetical protein
MIPETRAFNVAARTPPKPSTRVSGKVRGPPPLVRALLGRRPGAVLADKSELAEG